MSLSFKQFVLFVVGSSLVNLAAATSNDRLNRGQLKPSPPAHNILPPQAAPPANGASKLTGPLQEFLDISKKVNAGYGEVSVFKIVYQVENKFTHLVNAKKYNYHYEFVTQELGIQRPVEIFNKNYLGPLAKREFVLGSVVLIKDDSQSLGYKALFEIWNGDNLGISDISRVANSIKAKLPAGISFQFHPTSLEQEDLAIKDLPKSEYMLTKELIGDRKFLVFNNAPAVGYIRFSKNDPNQLDSFDLTTIAVFDKVPNDVGLIGAVITGEPQTPLSHVNVKSMNRGTLNFYLKDAREALKLFENKPVRITISEDGPVFEEIMDKVQADKEIAQFWKTRRPSLNGKPAYDLDPAYNNAFVNSYEYYKKTPNKKEHQTLIRKIGAKAANLGLLNYLVAKLALPGVTTPQAMGIPFNFYEAFIKMKQKGLIATTPEVSSTLEIESKKILDQHSMLNPNVIHSTESIRAVSVALKELYRKATVSNEMLAIFKKALIDDKSSPVHQSKIARLRLRSSTNSEDLDGFTGAGLYDSDGINLYKKKNDGTYDITKPMTWDEVATRIKRVIPVLYSSVWNERAIQEREWYQMNGTQHLLIKVGLAMHSAFPLRDFNGIAEHANGVAVTKNIYNLNESEKIYLNSQHFDLAVTNPPTDEELAEVGESATDTYRTEEALVTSMTADDALNTKPNNYLKWPIEILSKSSVKNGADVISNLEVRSLSRAFWLLNKEMAKVYGKKSDEFALDLEWKVYGPKRTLVIKQARPFSKE